ncbi:MAG: hypothetical protein JXB26_12595 [Candidatus Aminicenantes bacterium]|nr:hypothetical protein [Candidatus Aminicenantes bacterium]
MKKKKNQDMSFSPSHERGVGLVVVILVLAFMLAVGLSLVTVTGTGPQIASNVRNKQAALNAAEAGFDAGWMTIEDAFTTGAWLSFDAHYLAEPYGIDKPDDLTNYFRRLTDQELLNLIDSNGDGVPDVNNVIFFMEPYVLKPDGSLDPRYTYTVFLIDDEAGGIDPTNHNDTLMICIGTAGVGKNLSTTRLEIEMAVQLPGG